MYFEMVSKIISLATSNSWLFLLKYDLGHHPKYIGFFSFYIEVFKSLVDKEVNIGQKAYDFPMISQVAFKESSRN